MSNPQLAQEWRERLEDFALSEMTVQAWCDFNDVSVHQYYYWRRRLATADDKNLASGRWQALQIVDAAPTLTAKAGLSIHIAGAEIAVAAGFDPALLRAVVYALATPPC
jgi:hypothetical protein